MTEDIIRTKAAHLCNLRYLGESKDATRIEYPDGRVYDGNDNLIAEPPSYEQMAWVLRRLRGNARSWGVWDQ